MASWTLKIYSWFLLIGSGIKKFLMLMRRLRINSNTYCTRNIFLRNISRVGIPKSTVLVIIFIFLCGRSHWGMRDRSIIHLQCIEMVSKKIRYNLIKARWNMELLCCLLILKWHRRKIEIAVQRLKSKWICIVILLKPRMMHCLVIGKNTCLFTKAIKVDVKFWSGQIISPATWVWNGLCWYS